ncbi:MAG: hypothetical protein J0L57_17660 [Burkholderiales bacterium]|nr:hypothetical protein [Burkholderiales bacterium]
MQPEGSGIVMMFPCRSASHARRVTLARSVVRLELHACSTAGATWALAFADLEDPALIGPAMDELRAAAAANLGASSIREEALQVPGATPNPASRRVDLRGRAPDGRKLEEHVAVFSKGLRIYQATVLGEHLEPEAAGTFFAGLRLVP